MLHESEFSYTVISHILDNSNYSKFQYSKSLFDDVFMLNN